MTYVKSFFFDEEPFLLPYGTVKVYDAGVWALYHNSIEDWSLIVKKGKLGGRSGWRVRQFAGLMVIKHADNFVQTHCGGCLGQK